MNRKHYEAIAEALRPGREHDEGEIETLNNAAERIAAELKALEKNFDYERFLAAAGHRDFA